jgi:hypothetical protein
MWLILRLSSDFLRLSSEFLSLFDGNIFSQVEYQLSVFTS